jgi:hypothetical protein
LVHISNDYEEGFADDKKKASRPRRRTDGTHYKAVYARYVLEGASDESQKFMGVVPG